MARWSPGEAPFVFFSHKAPSVLDAATVEMNPVSHRGSHPSAMWLDKPSGDDLDQLRPFFFLFSGGAVLGL